MAKNTFKLLILMAILWIWLPTGILDVVFIPFIIAKIGFKMYVIISILMVIYLYRTIEGRTLKIKLNNISDEIKSFLGG